MLRKPSHIILTSVVDCEYCKNKNDIVYKKSYNLGIKNEAGVYYIRKQVYKQSIL